MGVRLAARRDASPRKTVSAPPVPAPAPKRPRASGGLWSSMALQIAPATDPLEGEADRAADRVLAGGAVALSPAAETQVRRKCAACAAAEDEPRVHRKCAACGAEPAAASPALDGGDPLDRTTRAFFEPRFGRDFSAVRVHTGSRAEESARSIDALAYTVGSHIAFGRGQFSPSSSSGRRLLAHELAHIAQDGRRGGVVHRQIDPTASSLTTGTVEGLSEAELREALARAVEQRLALPSGAPERSAVEQNGDIILRELALRGASLGAGDFPRPGGLPTGEGVLLVPAGGLPPELVATLPEGVAVTVSAEMLAQQGAGQADADTPPVSAGIAPSEALLQSVNTHLTTAGFVSAHDTAIGIIAIRQPPRVLGPIRAVDPAALADWWGHTAIYVRSGGRITAVSGFNPSSMWQTLINASAVEGGTGAVAGAVSSDAYLFTVPGARVLEYPVSGEAAANVAARIDPRAAAAHAPSQYTARPATWAAAHPEVPRPFATSSNCGLWACGELEAALGGRVGPVRGGQVVPVTEIARGGPPAAGTASQREITIFLREVAAGEAVASVPPGAAGPPVTAGMPRMMRFLKIGGRVMWVVSLAMVPIEVLLAPPGRRMRTFVGASAGLGGGIGGGVLGGGAAGFVCGPGAPVCVFIGVVAGGFIGYFAARAAGERLYDVATDFYPRQVADVMRDLDELVAEYAVIVGALSLSQRSDASLTAMGAADSAALRGAAARALQEHRAAARNQELAILRAFESAYERAGTSFAGLPELDRLRGEFLALQAEANPEGEEVAAWETERQERIRARDAAQASWNVHPTGMGMPPSMITIPPANPRTTQEIARDTFARIDRTMSRSAQTAEQIRGLEQWESIDAAFLGLHSLAFHGSATRDAGDWETISERYRELTVMMRNARYRLSPEAPGGAERFFRPGTAAYQEYLTQLDARERRYVTLGTRMTALMRGEGPPPYGTVASEEAVPSTMARGDVERAAAGAIATYDQLRDTMPASAAALATLDADAYEDRLDDDEPLARAIRRLEAAEQAMIAMVESARATRRTSGEEGPSPGDLVSQAYTAVRRRRDAGYLFASEVAAGSEELAARTRALRIAAIAGLFASGDAGQPLSGTERIALASDQLEDLAERLGIVADQIAQMPVLPTVDASGTVQRIYRLREWNGDLVTGQVLVGDLGPGADNWSPFEGHLATRRVVPLTRAAIALFGDVESRTIERRDLVAVTRRELSGGGR